MKTLKRSLVIVILVLTALVVGKNVIAKAAVMGAAKAITGLDVHLRSMSVGLLKTAVRIQGLEVHNPPAFVDSVMLDMPEIYVDYNLGSMLKGKPHLSEVRIHLAELDVIKNQEGAVNINSIQALQSGKPNAQAKPSPKTAAGPAPEFQIDRLSLKVGKVVYKDYTRRGAPPQVREFAVNINEYYEHITNPYTFAGLVISRALVKTTIGQLADIDVNALQAGVMNALKEPAGSLLPAANAVSKEAVGTAKEAVGTAQEAVKETTQGLKKLLGQ